MKPIRDIPKNSRKTIHVTLDEDQGHELVNIRVWYDAGDGEMRPTKKGISFKVDLLPDVYGALSDADAVCRGC